MRLLLLLSCLLLRTAANSAFYAHGSEANDKRIAYSTEQSALTLDVPIVFMESSFDEIFLSHDGIIGLGHRVPDKPESLQRMKHAAIAVFYAPVSEGDIHFRVTSSDQTLLRKLTSDVKQVFADSREFQALQAIVVTWTSVQNAEKDGEASFQIVLASDGIATYSIIHFGDLPWSSSMGYYAQSGFVHSEGKLQTNVNSGGPDVKELVNLSNNQFGNSFVFRVSGPAIEDPRDEGHEEYDYNAYDQEYEGETPADCPKDKYMNNCPSECKNIRDERGCPRCICAEKPRSPPLKEPKEPEKDPEEEEGPPVEQVEQVEQKQEQPADTPKLSCAQRTEKSCHTNSVCQDYDGGFCCSCEVGYYGNGKECLAKGEPQRITGSFEGVINGIPIDRTELHTFVTATDGNVYTAVSKIPSDLGHPIMLLHSIGSIMGWLFADVQSQSVANGFQLTGGLFNRSVTLHIGERYYVTIRQDFSGRDIYDYFKAHVFVSGTLPDIAPGSEITFPDYEEEYRREKRGFVSSYTGLDVVVKNGTSRESMRVTFDQQIHFDECPFKQFDKEEVMKLQVKRVHVTYNSNEGVVRYGSRNYANRKGAVAAAPEGSPHFDRKQHGLPTQQVAERPLHIPQSNDPCESGRHQCTLPHMKCRVVEPSYRCECEPGFQAQHDQSSPIGWKCADLDECQRGDHNCDQHAKCTNKEGSFGCECLPGFIGDGRTCIREHSGKSVPEQSAVSNVGATGEGLCTAHNQCHQWGECVFTAEHATGRCKCRGWYAGDGVNHCGPPEEKPKQVETSSAKRCGNSICDQNAECLPEPSGGSECVCKAGYTGDGVTCESLLSERQPQQPQTAGSLGKVCRSHDECSEHGSCAYHHSLGYYQCTCTEPYVGNGVDCTLPGSSPAQGADSSGRAEKLLIARGMSIFERSKNPDEFGKQLIVIPHHIPVSIDFDCKQEKIVWSDISGHSIRMASLNGTDHKSFLSDELSSPEGIAVDWSSRNVYYADSLNDEIGVASLNGKYKKALITEGLVNPRSLALDLNSKHLYYSDWHRENPYIGRVDLDGSNNRVFLNEDVHLPNGLTVLPNRRELCWVDAGSHSLSCIGFNGDGRRVVFNNLQYPFGLTHDEEQKFYWTDWKDNRVHSVGIYGEGYRSFQISLGGSGKVFGILSVPKTCVGAKTECGESNGGCDYLCLPSQRGSQCVCPDNVKVKGC